MNPYPPPFDAQRQAPVPRDADRASFSEVLPFASRKIALWRSPLLIVALLSAFAVPFLLFRFANITENSTVRDAFAAFGSYVFVAILFFVLVLQAAIYFYARPGRSFLFYLLASLFTAVVVATPGLFHIYAFVFRDLVPWGSLNSIPPHSGVARQFLTYFFAAGLTEELVKATPALIGALIAWATLRRPGGGGPIARFFQVRGPLDGVLLGIFAGGGFLLSETAFEYIPYTAQQAFQQAQSFEVGVAAGLNLLIPRVINGISGHMAYAALFGYFIGLGVLRRRHFWRLALIGWLASATVHGMWDSLEGFGDTAIPFYIWGALSALLAVAVILKARQLQLSVYGDAPDTMGSVVIDRSAAAPAQPAFHPPAPVAPPFPQQQAPAQAPWAAAPPPRPAPPLAAPPPHAYRLPAEDAGAEPTQTTHHETQSAADSPIPAILRPAPAPAQAEAEVPLEIDIDGLRIPVRAGVPIDLGAEPALGGRGRGVHGQIVTHPSRPGVLGLRNAGDLPWTATLRDGRAQAIGRDQNIRMVAGIQLDFGDGLVGKVVPRGDAG